jgi:hypothetical protein
MEWEIQRAWTFEPTAVEDYFASLKAVRLVHG